MGLDVGTLVIAANSNNILPRALETGRYEMRGVTATTSPSMDIQISSNFERYLFETSGRDASVVTSAMDDLARTHSFDLGGLQSQMTREFQGYWADEKAVAAAIKSVRDALSYTLDPHTACGYVAAKRWQEEASDQSPVVVLATAHPAKFPDAIGEIIGQRPKLPARLSTLMTDEERMPKVPNDRDAVKDYIYAHRQAVSS